MEKSVKQSITKKVLTIVLNVLFYLFICFLIVFSIANLRGREESVPNLFGYNFLSVQSSSMDGNKEDSFKKGDLVIGKIANDDIIANLKVGDIITFKDTTISDKTNQYNTHRIVAISTFEDGSKSYICQGDKVGVTDSTKDYVYDQNRFENLNGAEDEAWASEVSKHIQTVSKDQIISVYRGNWKNGGKTLDFLQSKKGFGLCIVLPTAILLLLEGFFLVRNILILNKQKMEESMAQKEEQQKAELEAEKARIREELLKEMEDKKNNN